jgi:putative membrane protein
MMPDERTLILCVDRDDDIGYKADVNEPAVGREKCLDAANRLALADPEDSDVNAIFQAIKTYDELSARGENVFVAVVGGSHTNMIDGDRRISHDLGKIVWDNEITECIIVTDGAEDEFVLPIIQASVDVKSVQRVIVKQMPNLEGTYYIIRKLLDDPKIARTFLVPVGLAMLLYAVANLLGSPEIAIVIVVGVIGVYLLFKGLGIDEYFGYAVNSLHKSFVGGRVTFVAYISALLIGSIGVIIGLTSLLEWYTPDQGLLFYLLSFVYGSIGYFTIAALTASIGKIIDVYLNEINALGRVIAVPFFIGAVGIIAYGASVYALSVGSSMDFPVLGVDSVRLIVYTTVIGLISASFGVYLQKYVSGWLKGAVEKDEL